MNIKYVTSSKESFDNNVFKLNLKATTYVEPVEKTKTILFEVNDNVKHKLENIFGVITFICEDYTSIKWQDNSKEKFSKLEMDKYIEKITEKVDMPIKNEIKESTLDLEKINMQRQLDLLQKDKKDQLVDKVKKYAANEIVELAISKTMIDEDDKEVEIQMVSMMNEEDYNAYCQNVLDFSNEHKVTSRVEEKDDRTEAEKMLDKIKRGGPIIGDFDNKTVISSSGAGGSSRKLEDLDRPRITITDDFKIPEFEDEFINILSKSVNPKEKTATVKRNDNFGLAQGLNVPIQIPYDRVNVGNDFSKLFNTLDWSM